MSSRAVVLYARISVATEESVSVRRQIASGRKYAEARGWRVVGEFIDDGVSASRHKPEDRPGWRSLMRCPMPFEAVVIWKVDRLARRVIDFLHADETLQTRDAAIVCVEQSIDMTTGEGRAFAQMLAVFGEMEASTISSRILAARAQLIAEGRIPGGRQPYGWRSIPNPNGAGYVRAQDPERIEWMRGMVERALRGDTVFSIMTWLNTAGAPGPPTRRPGQMWGYSAVNVLLRNPVLAGMFPRNLANGYGPDGGPEVRRDETGQPIVAGDGIITVEQYQDLLHLITHKAHPSARWPKKGRTSPLLASLVTCVTCGRVMVRWRSNQRPALRCRFCGQEVATAALIDYVVQRLLAERGTQRMYRRALVVPDDPAGTHKLASIDHALRAAALALTEDRTEVDTKALSDEVEQLKRARLAARRRVAATVIERLIYVGTVAEIWNLCSDDEQRHEVLAGQIKTFELSRVHAGGSRFRVDRVRLVWSDDRHPIVPEAISVGPVHERMHESSPWISIRTAARLLGSNETLIRRGIRTGLIKQRRIYAGQPSLDRASVLVFLRTHGTTG